MADIKDPKVAILSPVAESVCVPAIQHLMVAQSYASEQGIKITDIGMTERVLVHQARNILAKGFMDSKADWAFWWDCDMLIPRNTIPQLLQTAANMDAKFVTGVYYQRLGDHRPLIWRKNVERKDEQPVKLRDPDGWEESYKHIHVIPKVGEKRPLKVDVCGFGCVLTHRSMFEKIPYPWFKMLSGICSEDFYFCVEAGKAGFQLYADPTLRLGHIGRPEVVFQENCLAKHKTAEIKQEA